MPDPILMESQVFYPSVLGLKTLLRKLLIFLKKILNKSSLFVALPSMFK